MTQILDFTLNAATKLLAALGAVAMIFMAAIICGDVFVRVAFNSSITGVTEIVKIMIVSIVFLQLPDALWSGRIIRSSLLQTMLSSRPRVWAAASCLANAAGGVLMYFLITSGIDNAYESYEFGYIIGNPGVFAFPEWPHRAVLVGSCILLLAIFAVFGVRNIVTIVKGVPDAD